jgi:hypothetical protein
MLVMLLVVRVVRRKKLKEMELESENNEALQINIMQEPNYRLQEQFVIYQP